MRIHDFGRNDIAEGGGGFGWMFAQVEEWEDDRALRGEVDQ